jgi:hypothetical protein
MQITSANEGQTVTVPSGTIIDVSLSEGFSSPGATAGLVLVSARRGCNGAVRTSFTALQSGKITAEYDSIEASQHFVLNVLVTK